MQSNIHPVREASLVSARSGARRRRRCCLPRSKRRSDRVHFNLLGLVKARSVRSFGEMR